MKIARAFGLAVITALSMTALFGVSSAAAVNTTLCKDGSEVPYCKSENQYPAGTSLKASSSDFQIVTSLGTIKCEATLEGTTGKPGSALPIEPASWAFSGCKVGKSPTCSTTTSASPVGKMVVANENSGKLEWENATWSFTCGELIVCTFKVPTMTVEGSIRATGVPLSHTEGFFCPKTNTLTATFAPSAPGGGAPLWIAAAGSPPAKTTGLCKTLQLYCSLENLYPKETRIEGVSSDFKIDFPSSYGYGDLTCKKAVVGGTTTAQYNEPLGMSSLQFYQNECKAGSLTCTVNPEATSSTGISWNNADGLWGLGGQWTLSCGELQICTFTLSNSVKTKIEHGSPGTIRQSASLGRSGGLCPTSAELTATYPLSSPSGPLFFTSVLL